MGNLFFGLTCISYIGLLYINLYKPRGTGDQMVGWGFVQLAFLGAYVINSSLLTLNLCYHHKFDWISESATTRNVIIGFGFLCQMAGCVYFTFINGDHHNISTLNVLGKLMIPYAVFWIPLLMLVPYAILLKPEWQNGLSQMVYKAPLFLACLIGLIFHFGREQLKHILTNHEAYNAQKLQQELNHIGFTNKTTDLLIYLYDGKDERLTEVALAKLKKNENLEKELQVMLSDWGANREFVSALVYLRKNKVVQVKEFVQPLNKTLEMLAEELKYRLQSFGAEEDYLKMLDVEGICTMLEVQFKAYSSEFRPNMLKIQAELDKEPKPNFLEIRNKYRAAVKKWLEAN
ncbi:MAG: hypothetical protein JNM36_01515 [Chitinophagales bacterium]|nr:hypothetical protein [Chitinophagales bacterium]